MLRCAAPKNFAGQPLRLASMTAAFGRRLNLSRAHLSTEATVVTNFQIATRVLLPKEFVFALLPRSVACLLYVPQCPRTSRGKRRRKRRMSKIFQRQTMSKWVMQMSPRWVINDFCYLTRTKSSPCCSRLKSPRRRRKRF